MPIPPISDELHDLVGNPVPSSDLGQRARERATEIKRRRMAGIVTSVVAVSVLAVPGALLVRDQSNINGSAGAGSAEPSPAATAATSTTSAIVTKDVPHPRDASTDDQARFACALRLLGDGFTQSGSGVLIEAQTGKQVGTSATFTATDGGGTVGVQWTNEAASVTWLVPPTLTAVGPAPSGPVPSRAVSAIISAVAPPSLDPSGTVAGGGFASAQAVASSGPGVAGLGPVTGRISTDPLTNVVSGTVTQNGKLQVSVKVVQGNVGSPRILPGKAAIAFANDLLKAAG